MCTVGYGEFILSYLVFLLELNSLAQWQLALTTETFSQARYGSVVAVCLLVGLFYLVIYEQHRAVDCYLFSIS